MSKLKRVVLIEPCAGLHFFSFVRMPLLGLPILGEILRRMGFFVRIFCEKLAPIDWSEVAGADLVGISVLTNLAPRAYRIAAKVKEIAREARRKIWVVMGGPHATFMPEEALNHGADFVVRHEGETVFPMLVRYLGEGTKTQSLREIPGISYREGEEVVHNPGRPLVDDLDALPLPNFSLVEGAERMNVVPVQTSRGCPHDCEFCSVVKMFGHKIRYCSPENVVEELKRIEKDLPHRHVFFVDDNFSANPARVLSLLEAMRRARLRTKWSVQERISVAKRPEILRLMRETGCRRLYIGLESLNPAALSEWRKGQSPEEIKEGVHRIHREGLAIHGMFVLGADADTPESILDTVRGAIRLKLDTAQFFILVPPPGTRLFQKLAEEGRIFDRDWAHYDGHHVVFFPKNMSPWRLQALAIWAYERFYSVLRGIAWFTRLKFENTFFAFVGRRMLKAWLKDNRAYLARLRELSGE